MTLYVRTPSGRYHPANDDTIITAAKLAVAKTFSRGAALTSPDHVRRALQVLMADEEREHFRVLLLDAQHRIISSEVVSVGTIDAAPVYPRVVVKLALVHNAAAVILAHNHPSGEPEPSQADRNITGDIKRALALLAIPVLDHIVVGGAGTVSFAERGWI